MVTVGLVCKTPGNLACSQMTKIAVLLLCFLSFATAQCPLNSRRIAGHDGCTSCDVGEVSQGGSAITCAHCPAGTRAGRGVCVPCDIGSFSPKNSDVCFLCPAGTVAPIVGMSDCYSCAPDRVAFGTSECRSCPLGYQIGNDTSSCVPCPRGFARQQFDTQCVPCPPGSYAATSGAVECTLCGAGWFSAASGSIKCESCPAGSSSTPGVNDSNPCVPCPSGMTTYGQGGECVYELDDQMNKYRLSEGGTIAYSYTMGSVFFFLAVVGLLGQRWYDRIEKRERLMT